MLQAVGDAARGEVATGIHEGRHPTPERRGFGARQPARPADAQQVVIGEERRDRDGQTIQRRGGHARYPEGVEVRREHALDLGQPGQRGRPDDRVVTDRGQRRAFDVLRDDPPKPTIRGDHRRDDARIDVGEQLGDRDLVREDGWDGLRPQPAVIRIERQQRGPSPGPNLAHRSAPADPGVREPGVDPCRHLLEPAVEGPGLAVGRHLLTIANPADVHPPGSHLPIGIDPLRRR